MEFRKENMKTPSKKLTPRVVLAKHHEFVGDICSIVSKVISAMETSPLQKKAAFRRILKAIADVEKKRHQDDS